MRAEGLEPPRAFAHRHLKPARLPVSPRPRTRRRDDSRRPEPALVDRKLPHAPVAEVSSAFVAQVRNITPGYVVIHPNRDKAVCKVTRLIVVLILLRLGRR